MDIQLICVGKLKEKFWAQAVAEYQKRLQAFCSLTVTEIAEERLPAEPSPAQIQAALAKEAAAIRAKIPSNSQVIAFCIEGKLHSSEDMAALLQNFALSADKRLVFLMGGSFGLDEALKAQCQRRVSMSPMTFPHHLARVMALEQLYRGFQINRGGPYHK